MKKYPVIYVILAGLSWGSAGLFIHFLSAFGFESSDFTMARCMVSAVVALILALLFHRKNLRVTARQLVPLVGSGLSFCAMAYFYYMGIKYSSAPTAAMLHTASWSELHRNGRLKPPRLLRTIFCLQVLFLCSCFIPLR